MAKLKGYDEDGHYIGGEQPVESIKQIGSVNPISDFQKMISDKKHDRVSSAISQMQDLILRYIRNSYQGDLYQKALDCIRVLRQACISEDEAPQFNRFIEGIKQKYSMPLIKG